MHALQATTYADVSNTTKESTNQAKTLGSDPDIYTRLPTAKALKHERKRALSPDTPTDGGTDSQRALDAQPVKKKSKLKRIGNDGKPVRPDDDAVTVTTNNTPSNRKERRRLKMDATNHPLSEQPPADVDMDFFGESPKIRGGINKPSIASTITKVRPNGTEVNLSEKRVEPSISGNGAGSGSGSRPQNPEARRPASAAEAKPLSRPSAADGLFIKKKKV